MPGKILGARHKRSPLSLWRLDKSTYSLKNSVVGGIREYVFNSIGHWHDFAAFGTVFWHGFRQH
jgi:hypothetical protein